MNEYIRISLTPSMTISQFAEQLSKSEDWINERLTSFCNCCLVEHDACFMHAVVIEQYYWCTP